MFVCVVIIFFIKLLSVYLLNTDMSLCFINALFDLCLCTLFVGPLTQNRACRLFISVVIYCLIMRAWMLKIFLCSVVYFIVLVSIQSCSAMRNVLWSFWLLLCVLLLFLTVSSHMIIYDWWNYNLNVVFSTFSTIFAHNCRSSRFHSRDKEIFPAQCRCISILRAWIIFYL